MRSVNPPDEDIIEAFSEHAWQVLVVYGVEKLWLVYMATEGVSDPRVSQSTEGAVQFQSVVVELPQVFVLRQLQDVQTPEVW